MGGSCSSLRLGEEENVIIQDGSGDLSDLVPRNLRRHSVDVEVSLFHTFIQPPVSLNYYNSRLLFI